MVDSAQLILLKENNTEERSLSFYSETRKHFAKEVTVAEFCS